MDLRALAVTPLHLLSLLFLIAVCQCYLEPSRGFSCTLCRSAMLNPRVGVGAAASEAGWGRDSDSARRATVADCQQ